MRIIAYGGNTIQYHGICKPGVRHQDRFTEAQFYVTETQGPILDGLPTSRSLGLVSLNFNLGLHTIERNSLTCEWVSEWYQSLTAHQPPKGLYRAKTGDNDCNVNSSHYSIRTALCESICYQAKSEQNVRHDPIPRVRHGEAALCTPIYLLKFSFIYSHSQMLSIQGPCCIETDKKNLGKKKTKNNLMTARFEKLNWYSLKIQWKLGIRDTQGTVKNCPEFWGGLISQPGSLSM